MKPNDLINKKVSPTRINKYVISHIEVDLKHINYGLDKDKGYGIKARTHFKIEDIVVFFESLYQLEIEPETDENWEYYIVTKKFFGLKKKFRMVFCIDKEKPNTSGVITLFEVTRGVK